MPSLVISYRRDDSDAASARLLKELSQRLGDEAVFRDVNSISPGEPFLEAILQAISGAEVLLVVIGRNWAGEASPSGASRLREPGDFVRREVEEGLRGSRHVLPVLLDDARMPPGEDLPSSIRAITSIQAVTLRQAEWGADFGRLIASLRELGIPVHDPEDSPLKELWRYPFRLCHLLLRPKRFLATRTSGRQRNLLSSLLFFWLSSALATVVLLSSLPAFDVSDVLFVVPSTALAVSLVVSVPLYASFWCAGARRSYSTVLSVFLYDVSVLELIFGFMGAFLFTALRLDDGELYTRLYEALFVKRQSSGEIFALHAVASKGELVRKAQAVMTVLAAGVLVWLFVSWGAYRRALGLSRLRSSAAFLLLLGPPVLIIAAT